MSSSSPQNIAVVVAHPDDEVLAFGGAIARHSSMGDHVHILIMATGLAARGVSEEAAFAELRDHALAAANVLGANPPTFGSYPDNRMDTVALLDVVQTVERFFDQTQPDIVYTHHAGDLNIDHRVTAEAVLTATRPLPGRRCARLYAGEVLSSSEFALPQNRFIPNAYVDITPWLETKKRALSCYEDEVCAWPHPRSTEATEHLARLRGSEVGLDAAEALCLVRTIIR